MAIYKEDFIDFDLQGGVVHRTFANNTIGAGDYSGDHFGFRLWNRGQAVDLSQASCIGYFMRADGTTLVINGATNRNAAAVALPAAAYAVEGKFTLVLKLSGTGYAGTMRIVDGVVVKTTTGEIMDPSSEVPSLEELMEVIERAEDAAETINGLVIEAEQISGTRFKIEVTKT